MEIFVQICSSFFLNRNIVLKMSNFFHKLAITTIGVTSFILGSAFENRKAEAVTLTGILSSINGVSYTFTETKTTGSFTLTGGAIAFDESITITIPGTTWWTVSGGITLDADIDDEIRLNVNLQHTFSPHPEDGGNGQAYTSSLVFLAEDGTNDSTYTVSGPGGTLTHGQHRDIFSNEKITGTIDTTPVFDIDDIDSWSYTLNGVHQVPEPITGPGLGVAVGFGFFFKRNFQKNQKIAKN
jgi:hypothetical protein